MEFSSPVYSVSELPLRELESPLIAYFSLNRFTNESSYPDLLP